jgi:putative membrane protein
MSHMRIFSSCAFPEPGHGTRTLLRLQTQHFPHEHRTNMSADRHFGDDDDDPDDDLDGDREELAEQRTGWAKERTLLAKERTFAAWLRTGLASFAVGFAVAELLGEVGPPWLALAIGVALILAGAAVVAIGFLNYRRALDQLEQHGVRGLPVWAMGTVAAILVLVGIAGVALVLSR